MSNEITTINNSPAEMIKMALAGGADLEELAKFLSLQQQWEAGEARKAYNKAMAAFKENPPHIEKDKKVGYTTQKGKVGYSHASLANVVEKITAGLSNHGLSASWKTKQNGAISVTCVITHVMGHSEEVTLTANADMTGSKNDIQALGSTITYLQRYTILAATGLATADMDNDGVTEEAVIDENKIKILKDLIKELAVDEAQFMTYMAVEKIEDIPMSGYGKAKLALEARRKAKK